MQTKRRQMCRVKTLIPLLLAMSVSLVVPFAGESPDQPATVAAQEPPEPPNIEVQLLPIISPIPIFICLGPCEIGYCCVFVPV